ncbi:DUF2079 domain-containing protein [Brachybacterium nesterenkovii]|uniref:DUF2079 domain-containing protein n=1 Tax=Brachybacterium nesterenkovii TaxID=47847 RepID=A0A1X6X1D7_9MICO|nr:DUF2079 domain-containing protein [Brachybacterium nesterenkovii]SLM92291.1 hypothetical protein FM110_07835 [Brachybacterium nesterenkovii]
MPEPRPVAARDDTAADIARADRDDTADGTPRSAVSWIIPVLIAVAATAAYGTLSTLQWRTLQAPSWDPGIFSELAKAYSRLEAPIVPIKGDDVNLLGDHFHPILVLLGPIWAIWPSGLALLWTQAALFGVSAIPLARLAIERLGTVTGTLAGIAYAFSFGLQSAQDVQFHEIAFGVPILAMSLTRLLRGRVLSACIWGGLLVFVKEDLGLTVLMLGLVIALRGRAHRLEGIGLALWGGGWFVLSMFVILPLLNTAGQYDYTDNLGSLWEVFVPLDKWQTVVMLILLAGCVGLRSPLMALMLPTLAWRFTGTVEFYWDWYWHYNAVLMPIALASLLDVAPRLRPWNRAVAVIASLGVTAMLAGSMPLADLVRPASWEPTWRAEPARAAMEAVPDGATVATDITLMSPLVTDHDVQWTHGPNRRVPQCVLTDQYAFSWGTAPPTSTAAWADEHYGQAPGTFTETFADGGFAVACR